ncbi:MAG: hypothetical protein JHC61_03505 [Burkholderiaceae bacterium]|nr:hypothetical protein [Burkholderiaceae bacterium]
MTSDIDFFAVAAQPTTQIPTLEKAPKTVPGGQALSTETQTNRAAQSWKDKVKTVHFLVLGGILASGWALWPALISTSTQNSLAMVGSSVSIAPTTRVSKMPPKPETQAEIHEAEDQLNSHDQKNKKENIGEKDIALIKYTLIELQKQQQAIQASQAELKAALLLLMSQNKGVTETEKSLKEQKATSIVKTAGSKPQTAKNTAKKLASSLPSLKINTIYPGQAWIDAPQGKTYIVHVGDTLEGAQILSIDESARVVHTTQGAIR